MSTKRQVVIDTNVLVAALRSRTGASHQLMKLVDRADFEINLSVPLVLEYESAAMRLVDSTALTRRDINDVLDYLCSVANLHSIYFLWRPWLPDPNDDMVLELAVTAGCVAIITYNVSDFRGVEQFGVRALTPIEFLKLLE